MAKSSNATEVEVGGEQEAPRRGARSHMAKHEAFVEWYADTTGVDLAEKTPAEVIAAFAARRNEFRRSDSYQNQWSKDQLAARKAEREAAKAAAKAERDAAKAAAAAEKPEGEAATPRKRTARKAKAATPEVDATDGAEGLTEEEVFA
jgi:hypothetical protein